ncbi:hypothetical protein [Actinoplanes sp. TFC3]|uniref:hypothetical protein n=1 Tax=Actinoplanes sp. TFC3 TaxID=1710355 RepID=UPI000834CA5A|nr:hypothetical protein [Actinoplanes sp. TFC3]
MAAIEAISSTTSTSAQTELEKYQQKLAADLAAKAAEKVIAADKAAVTKAQQAQAQQTQSQHSQQIQAQQVQVQAQQSTRAGITPTAGSLDILA